MKIYDRSSSGSNLCLATVVALCKAEGASPGGPPLGRRMQCESGIAYAVPTWWPATTRMDLTKEQVRQMVAEQASDTEDASSY
jgi:hypothetical protein